MAYDRMYTASMSLLDATTAMIPKKFRLGAALFKSEKFSEVVLTGLVVFHVLAKPFPKPTP
jgi:hypothetical protein